MNPKQPTAKTSLATPALPPTSRIAAPTSGTTAFTLSVFLQTAAFGQGMPASEPQVPLDIVVKQSATPDNAARLEAITSLKARGEKLAASIASAANQNFVQVGIEVAKEAILNCQKGDYPGAGTGLLSMPLGRPSSRTDHCFR